MFVAVLTIRIYDTDIFHHAVKINDAVIRATEGLRYAPRECVLVDRLLLQTLPAAAVQNARVRQMEGDALGFKRFHKVIPNHIRHSVNQYLEVFPFSGAVQQLFCIKFKIAVGVTAHTTHHFGGE